MSERTAQHDQKSHDKADTQIRHHDGAASIAPAQQVGADVMFQIRGKNQAGMPHEFGNLVIADDHHSNMTRGHKNGSGDGRHKGHDGDHSKETNPSPKAKESGADKQGEPHKPNPEAAKQPEQDYAQIVGSPKASNPDKRNVVVLDEFQTDHGRIIADSLEQKGFNVYRAQASSDTGAQSHTEDFSKALESVNKKVEDGTLPLQKGDVVTLSMGQNKATEAQEKEAAKKGEKTNPGDPTFDEASKDLKMKITPENLKEQKGKILDRMRLVADGKDPETGKPTETDPALQERMRSAVNTNDAISKLQDKGISVMHAAGNDGPDRFSWDTLTAAKDLDSRKPNGECDNFSGCNSNTTPGDGVFQWKQTQPSLFDKTPLAMQKNDEQLVGGVNHPKGGESPGMEGPSTLDRDALRPGFEGAPGANRADRHPDVSNFAFNPDVSSAKPLTPMPKGLESANGSGTYSFYIDHDKQLRRQPNKYGPPTDHFQKSGEPAPKVTNLHVKPTEPNLSRKETIVGSEVGTSFSVIRALDGKSDRNTSLDTP